jgi:Transglycosylase SLT domain
MTHRTTARDRARSALARLRPPSAVRRPSVYLGVAAGGAVLVNVLATTEPSAQADTPTQSMSIAQQLGLTESATPLNQDTVRPLEELAASRGQREAERTAAAQTQAAADQKELAARRAALEASRQELARRQQAVAEARARAEAEAEAAAATQAAADQAAAAAAPAASGSFQDYALGKLGGNAGQFSCLESLWGKESGWNPNAQNPSSTAYGIPQFLDSTWASTGIAKTSDGYRQIDAGLIYIDSRYGSPCGAWDHSQANGWY